MATKQAAWIPVDDLATRLLVLRHQRGLSQREAADRCGITYGAWQSMEDGRQARGLDQKVAKIADALGVDREWLMWGGPLAASAIGRYPTPRFREGVLRPLAA
jgi:transcriptional regulator with XRE-family HTH domain